MELKIRNNELDTEFTYDLDLTKLIELYRTLFNMANTNGIQLPDGRVIQIGKPSVPRTLLKAAIPSVFLPILKDMAVAYGIVLEPPSRHEDLIEYSINTFLDILLVVQGKTHVNFTSKTGKDCRNTIESGFAFIERESQLAIEESTEASTEDS